MLVLLTILKNVMTEIMQSLKPVKAMDGANKFITSLTKREKYAFAFATGSLLQPALHKLRQAGIWHEKTLIASSNNYYTREEIVTDAIERAKMYYNTTEFERIISIGDGIWDLKTAQNLGIHFIGVGQKNDQKFKHENVKVITDNWENFDIENAINFL
jgi:phosphoglycolate phosphatase-like HAD superfamily hydrolase